jgi:hypothetical protein
MPSLPVSLVTLGFPTSCYACLLVHMHATCTAHLILLDLITWTVFDEQQKLWNSSIVNFLCPPVISLYVCYLMTLSIAKI